MEGDERIARLSFYSAKITLAKRPIFANIKITRETFFSAKKLEKYQLKGTVSRDLRWVLLDINQKLFSRAIVTHHKILILSKGHFTIKKRRSSE